MLNPGFSVEAGGRLIAGIDPTLSGNTTKTYGYHPIEYFLTSADGPWGSLEWTYDRIGNRTSETHAFGTDLYYYDKNGPSGTGGNTALLRTVTPALGGSRDFDYTLAGDQKEVDNNGNLVTFSYDTVGRLSEADRTGAAAACPFVYDGRGYLRQAGDLATTGTVVPTYDSEGLLHSLLKQPSATDPERRYHVFYLAGRPVAQLATEAAQPDRWWYLTTDHLGTPLLATDAAGAELWENRFEPFGGDPTGQALEAEIFLRFPGQWDDGTWEDATLGAGMVYNLNRWYQVGFSRFQRVDPLGVSGLVELDSDVLNLMTYSAANPTTYSDPEGLISLVPDDQLKRKCQRRWRRKILPRLQRIVRRDKCNGFFCKTLGADLPSLLSGAIPLLVTRRSAGGGFTCHRDLTPGLSQDVDIEPFAIKVGRPSLCGSTRREAVHVILHELAHYADCWSNNDRFKNEEEGCGAEVACFGFSIGRNCSARGYPTRQESRGLGYVGSCGLRSTGRLFARKSRD